MVMRGISSGVVLLAKFCLVCALVLCATGVIAEPRMRETDLFVSGSGGYHSYRIPAIVPVGGKTLLAFCEGRKNSGSDSGDIDILLRRSLDSGETWQDIQLVVSDGTNTCGNPCPIVDKSNGTVWLLFCKNPGRGADGQITNGRTARTAWVTKSTDSGVTWSEPIDISKDIKEASWTWYATGPGHGIQLKSSRLVAACDHVRKDGKTPAQHSSHIVYSDDHGKSWKIGGSVDLGTNESTAVELSDGRLCINCRNSRAGVKPPVGRVCAWSKDGGLTFAKATVDETLREPICEASILRIPGDGDQVLFSNPASGRRENMTLRLSRDGCNTWPVSKVLYKGHSAYSDLAVAQDGDLCCLYERGEKNAYQKITFTKFNLEWLTKATDSQ